MSARSGFLLLASSLVPCQLVRFADQRRRGVSVVVMLIYHRHKRMDLIWTVRRHGFVRSHLRVYGMKVLAKLICRGVLLSCRRTERSGTESGTDSVALGGVGEVVIFPPACEGLTSGCTALRLSTPVPLIINVRPAVYCALSYRDGGDLRMILSRQFNCSQLDIHVSLRLSNTAVLSPCGDSLGVRS
jgi:hypothetical protein